MANTNNTFKPFRYLNIAAMTLDGRTMSTQMDTDLEPREAAERAKELVLSWQKRFESESPLVSAVVYDKLAHPTKQTTFYQFAVNPVVDIQQL